MWKACSTAASMVVARVVRSVDMKAVQSVVPSAVLRAAPKVVDSVARTVGNLV